MLHQVLSIGHCCWQVGYSAALPRSALVTRSPGFESMHNLHLNHNWSNHTDYLVIYCYFPVDALWWASTCNTTISHFKPFPFSHPHTSSLVFFDPYLPIFLFTVSWEISQAMCSYRGLFLFPHKVDDQVTYLKCCPLGGFSGFQCHVEWDCVAVVHFHGLSHIKTPTYWDNPSIH